MAAAAVSALCSAAGAPPRRLPGSAQSGIAGGAGRPSCASCASSGRGAPGGGGGIRAAAVELERAVSVPRLRKIYLEKVVPALQDEYKYANAQEVPYVKKIVVNCGVGEAAQNAKTLESTIRDMASITGQRPVTTRAKKAIAGFKLRQGVPVGVSVTLRGEVMYSFMDRLVNLALPRTRDFQGVNPYSFDGKGNFTLGLREQSVFPEIRFENIDRERGMDVSIISTARSDTEGQKLLSLMGMPFKEGSSASAARAAKVLKSGRSRRSGAQKRAKGASKGAKKKK